MIATLSYGGSKQKKIYRIAIRRSDREVFKGFDYVTIRIDGIASDYRIKPSFWNSCNHVDDTSNNRAIEEWGIKNGLIPWNKGKPPKVNLVPVGHGVFELSLL